MISPEIEKILLKFFNRSATKAELEILDAWLKEPHNESIFKDYVKVQYAITLGLNDPNTNKMKELMLAKIRKEKKPFYNYKLKAIFKYAAILVLFLGIGYLVKQNIFNSNNEELLIPNYETITLQLENGDTQIISEVGNAMITDSLGNKIMYQQGNQLVYNRDIGTEKLVYNTLSIPYGKRFDILLSDGTHVYLNSGSSIKYPVKFIEGEVRKVFLQGEAFFDVAKDKKHPFLIESRSLNIKVLGTQFNVSTYPEDTDTEVVLVEGSLSLNSLENKSKQNQNIILEPGFKGVFNTSEKTIATQKVNTSMYTSWIKGNLIFRNQTFDNIIKKLERHYNISIINNNQDLAKETFNASFEIDKETINEVFYYFNKVYQIEYKIIDNKIIIE